MAGFAINPAHTEPALEAGHPSWPAGILHAGVTFYRYTSMTISTFDDLLAAARRQPEPQRLLFVFTALELPDDASPEQRARFQAGSGGALTPMMCLDKAPEDLSTFSALLQESRQVVQEWAIVFVAAISGHRGRIPSTEEAEAPLNHMVESIKSGNVERFIPFDVQGQPVIFGPGR